MQKVFIIKNQDNLLLSKKNEWISGWDTHYVFRSSHLDIALNTLIEANARDVSQRLTILEVEEEAQNKLNLPEGIDMTPYEIKSHPFEGREHKAGDLQEAASA